jgi:hypothetical protein
MRRKKSKKIKKKKLKKYKENSKSIMVISLSHPAPTPREAVLEKICVKRTPNL